MKTSAYYSPAASITELVETIINNNNKKVLNCSTMLNGEYGVYGKCLGVPVILNKNGIEQIIIYDLRKEELNVLQN